MSTLSQQVRATAKAMYTGQVGDDAYYLEADDAVGYGYGPYGHGSYGHGSYSAVAESCRVQFEPWENVTTDTDDSRMEHIETMITVTIGTETGDVADVKKGGVFVFDGFWWSVMNVAMRTRTSGGWARCRVNRGRTISIGSPGTVTTLPGVSSGGRFDMRGK